MVALPRLLWTRALVLASCSSSQTYLASRSSAIFTFTPALTRLAGDVSLFPVKRPSLDLYFAGTAQGYTG